MLLPSDGVGPAISDYELRYMASDKHGEPTTPLNLDRLAATKMAGSRVTLEQEWHAQRVGYMSRFAHCGALVSLPRKEEPDAHILLLSRAIQEKEAM